MNLKNTNITEYELFSSLWWLWCNQKININDIKHYIQDLDIELDFITFNGYKFISKDKKTIYSYDRQ
jgi:hypothetical protein